MANTILDDGTLINVGAPVLPYRARGINQDVFGTLATFTSATLSTAFTVSTNYFQVGKFTYISLRTSASLGSATYIGVQIQYSDDATNWFTTDITDTAVQGLAKHFLLTHAIYNSGLDTWLDTIQAQYVRFQVNYSGTNTPTAPTIYLGVAGLVE